MANKQVPISNAKADELRAFASKHLGLEVPDSMVKAEVISLIKSAWPKDHILVEDGENPHQSAPRPDVVMDPFSTLKPGYVRLIVQIVDEPGGDEHVPVGVNGKVMLIPRGKEVDVPHRYFEALSHAIRHVYDALRDGGINPVPRKVSAYPHQVIAIKPELQEEAAA